jgi:hypothetical protein
MQMQRTWRLLSILLVLAAAPSLVQARSIAGYGGKAWNAVEANCFSDAQGNVVSNCTGRYWFIPLDMRLPTTQVNPAISVYRPSTSVNVGCQTFAVSTDLLTVSTQQSMQYAPLTGVQTIRPGWISAAGQTFHAFAWCYMDSGTRVIDVNW